ncbi:MAG: histidine phosphatase family protein [Actinomycetota bacterium]
MTAGTVILWRHGQTDYNLEFRVQGGVDIPLNRTGLAQAAASAAALQRYLGGVPTSIVTSTLVRARDTARLLADLLEVEVAADRRLKERAFGLWEGLTRDQMVATWPEEYLLWKSGETPSGIGMETRTEVADRVHAAVLEHAERLSLEETLVVVSHGSAIAHALGRMLSSEPGRWFPVRALDNAHWSTLQHAPNLRPPWRLKAHNLGPL